ncbi:cytochrome P450 [Mycolicibacterium sediminis]|uniref:cytochrome P450 n=1 Tax=Mycolicibacterium sediminis TaxID=1286180 RepID=UPI0013D1FDA5|nr:cytochrome P450 [Mycolicibacterium sediminis]
MTVRRPQLTGARALATLADLGLASVAAGVILRRKPVVAVLEKVQADGRALRRMRALRAEFGRGPVELVLPVRRVLVITDPEDVGRVLAETPDPFHPANREKRQALRPFQPRGVLISRGAIRAERRALNEAALDTGLALNRIAPAITEVVAEEAEALAESALAGRRLTAAEFETAWWRVVRRVVLGDAARDDSAITDQLRRLRASGNWSFAGLPHPWRRDRFTERLHAYAEAPDPNSLLGALAEIPARAGVDPVGQVPQWLFAYDAAGMATIRALALLTTHPEQRAAATAEIGDPSAPAVRPYLRGCVLESIRLWPTTPAVLRDMIADTEWGTGAERFRVESGAAVLIAAPAFHRDADLVPFADEFEPQVWVDGRAQEYPQLIPFSDGPGECPGRDVVMLTTSTMLANLMSRLRLTLRSSMRPYPGRPLPMTFNQYGVEFDVAPVTARP